MKWRVAFATLVACLVAGPALAMTVSSPDLQNGIAIGAAQIKAECGGLNRPPGISWSGAPVGTQSFAVTLYDPDAGDGHGWWHWVVIDIPASVNTISRGLGVRSLPPSVMALPNDFQKLGYGGPCPPAGQRHRYILTVWALPVARLPFDRTAVGANIEPYLKKHALASGTITAVYGGDGI